MTLTLKMMEHYSNANLISSTSSQKHADDLKTYQGSLN